MAASRGWPLFKVGFLDVLIVSVLTLGDIHVVFVFRTPGVVPMVSLWFALRLGRAPTVSALSMLRLEWVCIESSRSAHWLWRVPMVSSMSVLWLGCVPTVSLWSMLWFIQKAPTVLIVSYESSLDSRGNSFRSLGVLMVLVTSTSSCGPRMGWHLSSRTNSTLMGDGWAWWCCLCPGFHPPHCYSATLS